MWKIAYFCKSCKQELTRNQRMYSYGVCPLCGYKDIKNLTIVATIEMVKKYIKIHPWWKFWIKEKGYWEFKDN